MHLPSVVVHRFRNRWSDTLWLIHCQLEALQDHSDAVFVSSVFECRFLMYQSSLERHVIIYLGCRQRCIYWASLTVGSATVGVTFIHRQHQALHDVSQLRRPQLLGGLLERKTKPWNDATVIAVISVGLAWISDNLFGWIIPRVCR